MFYVTIQRPDGRQETLPLKVRTEPLVARPACCALRRPLSTSNEYKTFPRCRIP